MSANTHKQDSHTLVITEMIGEDGKLDPAALLRMLLAERQENKDLRAQNHILTVAHHIQQTLRKTAERAAQRWEELAHTDSLTGMFNHRKGFGALEQLAHRRKHEHPEDSDHPQFTLLFIDLDGFGQINKKHGDQTGDTALQLAAKTILGCLRESDYPYAFRKGGDEFIIGLEETSLEDTNDVVIERLVRALDGQIEIRTPSAQIISVRGSIGAYAWNDDLNLEQNIIAADGIMREQKNTRKLQQRLAKPDFTHIVFPSYQFQTPEYK